MKSSSFITEPSPQKGSRHVWDIRMTERVVHANDIGQVDPVPFTEETIKEVNAYLDDADIHPSLAFLKICDAVGNLPFLLATPIRGVDEEPHMPPLHVEFTANATPKKKAATKQDPCMARNDLASKLIPYARDPSAVHPPVANTAIYAGSLGHCTLLQQGEFDIDGGLCENGTLIGENLCPVCGMPIFNAFYNLIALTQVGSHRTCTKMNQEAAAFSSRLLARQIDMHTAELLQAKGVSARLKSEDLPHRSGWVSCSLCRDSMHFDTASSVLANEHVQTWTHKLRRRYDTEPYHGRWFIPSRHFFFNTIACQQDEFEKKVDSPFPVPRGESNSSSFETMQSSPLERLGVKATIVKISDDGTRAEARITQAFVLQEQVDDEKCCISRHVEPEETIHIVANALPSDIQGTTATGKRMITLNPGENVICGVFTPTRAL